MYNLNNFVSQIGLEIEPQIIKRIKRVRRKRLITHAVQGSKGEGARARAQRMRDKCLERSFVSSCSFIKSMI